MSNPLRRLRQVQIMVADLDAAAETLGRTLNLATPWKYDSDDGTMRMWGLRAGDTFLELMTPCDDRLPSARFLRRHGDGLYLLVLESERERDEYALELLHRWVHLSGIWEDDQYRLIWVHPKAANGVILELGEVMHPENPWTGGGGPGRDDWFRAAATGDIRQLRHAAVVVGDLERALRRWRALFSMQPVWQERTGATARAVLPFADGDTALELRQPLDAASPEAAFLCSRGEGLFSLVLEASALGAIEARAGESAGIEPLTVTHPELEGFVLHGPSTAGARLEIVAPVDGGAWPMLARTIALTGRRS